MALPYVNQNPQARKAKVDEYKFFPLKLHKCKKQPHTKARADGTPGDQGVHGTHMRERLAGPPCRKLFHVHGRGASDQTHRTGEEQKGLSRGRVTKG